MSRFTTQLTTQLRAIRPAPSPPPAPHGPTLVAVAHGSRDPAARRTVERLLARVRALRPGLRVELGHIELDEPLLPDALAALPAATPHGDGSDVIPPGEGSDGSAITSLDDGSAVLVPLLFGPGYHTKHDIPRALDAAPRLRATVAAPLGPHPLLAEALYDRLMEAAAATQPRSEDGELHASGQGAAGSPEGPVAPGLPVASGLPADAVVLAAAGSRDPESLDGADRMAVQLSARLGGLPVRAAYASAAGPTVPDAVRELKAAGHERVALAAYFTAPGYFATRCAATPGLAFAAAPLGPHTALARLILRRYDHAVGSRHPAERQERVAAG